MNLGYKLYCDEKGEYDCEKYEEMVKFCKEYDLTISDHRPEYFEIVEIPKLTYSEKVNLLKSIRSQKMSDILTRCDRYEKQTAAGLDTTDTADMYYKMLIYLQYLRDIPQLENFPDIEVLSFEQWTIGATGLRTTDDRNGE